VSASNAVTVGFFLTLIASQLCAQNLDPDNAIALEEPTISSPVLADAVKNEARVLALLHSMKQSLSSFNSTDDEAERQRLVVVHRRLLLKTVALMRTGSPDSPSRLVTETVQAPFVPSRGTSPPDDNSWPSEPGERELVQRRLNLMRMTLESVLDHMSMRSQLVTLFTD
jgi:hypothetical protein